MLGWLADFFRLIWGLFYWNTRKSWFRLRRGRSRCPCQSPSDSGRALETTCEACVSWDQPVRFRRVCPLLVETRQGLRCSVNTADVRPFWGRVALYLGGTLLAFYVAGVVLVFSYLRSEKYPVSLLHVAWPGLWYRVPQARAWWFADKADRALAAGQTKEGLLYLSNAYDLDPTNYLLGLKLAENYQLGLPEVSDRFYDRLMTQHPDYRDDTAQTWYRALLARGDFTKAANLARSETVVDSAHANFWIRGLLFTTRQNGDEAPLRALLGDSSPTALPWHQLLETELLVRAGRTKEVQTALARPWPATAPPFTFFYQVRTLASIGNTLGALDLLEIKHAAIGDEVYFTLRLDTLAAAGKASQLSHDVDLLLAQSFNLPTIKLLCTHLIRWPNPALFAKLSQRIDPPAIPFNNDSAGIWLSLMCAAGVVGDDARMHQFANAIKNGMQFNFRTLDAAERFFRGEAAARRVTSLLPALPLPLDVTYALIERYPGTTITLPGMPPSR